MKVNRSASVPSSRGPAESFTGVVRRDGLIASEAPGRVLTGLNTFEPGARTAWHKHPAGQILIITAGRGWVQGEGQPRHEVTAGLGLDSGQRAPLAWRDRQDRDDAHRRHRVDRRQRGHLARACVRRGLSARLRQTLPARAQRLPPGTTLGGAALMQDAQCIIRRRGVVTPEGIPVLNRLPACLAAAALWAAATAAVAFPERTVTLVVPFPAGASTDIAARDLAQELAVVFKQAVVVDNKAGAEGAIGAQAMLSAPPDGHTMLFTSSSTTVLDPVLKKTMAFDPVKDFIPICSATQIDLFLYVTGSSPYKSVPEFIAAAKAQPGKLTFAYTSATTRLSAELFALSAGIKLTGIPYKAVVGALTDVSSATVDMMVVDQVSGVPFVQSGKLRMLAIAATQRSPFAPDTPTGPELGLADFTIAPWNGLFVSAKTPPAAVERLRTLVLQATQAPSYAANLTKRSLRGFHLCGEALGTFQRDDIEKARRATKAAGIEPQ
jgi:tripartite-type tricarboxylate transporter receptor subunit TctC